MLLGQAAMLAFIYFNQRVMARFEMPSASDWDDFLAGVEEEEQVALEAADDAIGAAEPAIVVDVAEEVNAAGV